MLDGIIMEKLGVPTVVVSTEPFVNSVKAMAASHGIPGYPFVVIPHPIVATPMETLERWADSAMDQVIQILSVGVDSQKSP